MAPNGVTCPQNKKILANLCMLFGLCNLTNDHHSLYECGYFKEGVSYQFLILEAIKQINRELRPYIVSILESLDFCDEQINSAIGNSYGDIYETHLEWAKNSRLNTTKDGDSIPDGYKEYMMPLLKGKM